MAMTTFTSAFLLTIYFLSLLDCLAVQLLYNQTNNESFAVYQPNSYNLKTFFKQSQSYLVASADVQGQVYFSNLLSYARTNGPFDPCNPSITITSIFMAPEVNFAIICCKNGATALDHNLLQLPLAGTPLLEIQANIRQVNVITFNANKDLYVAGQNQGYFSLFDVGHAEPFYQSIQVAGITAADFSNLQLISDEEALGCYSNGVVNVFNYTNGSVIRTFPMHGSSNNIKKAIDCKYISESQLVVSAGLDGFIFVSEYNDGLLLKKLLLNSLPRVMLLLPGKPVSPTSRKQILVALSDMKIYLYDEGTNQLLEEPQYVQTGNVNQFFLIDQNVFITSFANSPDIKFFCTTYKTHAVDYIGQCICPQGFYNSQTDSKCLQCPLRCITCDNGNACLSCKNDRQNITYDCACPVSYYEDSITQECQPCLQACWKCTKSTECTQCLDVTYNPPLCNQCTAKQYLNQGQCNTCPNVCATCQNSTGCITCLNPLLQTPSCSNNCINGYYYYNNACLTCLPQCSLCSNSVSCLACVDSLKQTPQCELCKDKMYLYNEKNSGQSVCLDCQYQCATCTNSIQCTSCAFSGFQLPSCLQCFDGLHLDQTSKTCKPCLSQCKTCSSDSTCDTCTLPGRDPNTLCASCYTNMFQDQNTKECIPCLSVCLTCTNATACVSCSAAATSAGELPPTCLTCAAKQFQSLGSCYNCMSQCSACTSSASCTQCVDGTKQPPDCQPKNCQSGQFYNSISKLCEGCSLQCSSCSGTASNCKQCKSNVNGIEPAPSCALPFQCNTTVSLTDCLKCRGNRINAPNCECPAGTYEDEISDQCPSCLITCLTCSNSYSCSTCPQGTEGPNTLGQCVCQRSMPFYPFDKPTECATCKVAYPLIQFSEDLESILISFQYPIILAVTGASQPSINNCQFIFESSTIALFGANPLCFMDSESSNNNNLQIVVQLGSNSTVQIGDLLQIRTPSIREPNCTEFIINFRSNTVQGPKYIRAPIVTLNQPSQPISPCSDFTIQFQSTKYTGNRDLVNIQWSLQSIDPPANTLLINQKLQVFSQNSSSLLYLRPMELIPLTTYIFQVTFYNFLGRQGSTQITIQTQKASNPSIKILLGQSSKYYVNQQLQVPIQINSFECSSGSKTAVTSDVELDLKVTRSYDKTDIYQATRISIKSGSGSSSSYFSLPAYTFTPLLSYLVNVTASFTNLGDTIVYDTFIINFSRSALQIQLPGYYGISVLSNFQLSIKVIDPDENLPNNASATDVTLTWDCQNLISNPISCTGRQGAAIVLSPFLTQTFASNTLAPNTVYRFTILAEKDQRKVQAEYLIFTTNQEFSELGKLAWMPNINSSDLFINEKDDTIIILKDEQFEGAEELWIAIIHANQVLSTQLMTSPIFHFKLSDYSSNWAKSDYIIIYFLPLDISIRFNLNQPPKYCQIYATPSSGLSLSTVFTINVVGCQDAHQPLTYAYYYYLEESSLDSDVYQNADFSLGYPLATQSDSNSLSTVLPAGIGNTGAIYILVQVTNNYGGDVTLKLSQPILVDFEDPPSNTLQKSTPFYSLVTKINAFTQATVYNKTKTLLQKIAAVHLISIELKTYDYFYSQSICQKNCNQKGTCQVVSASIQLCQCQAINFLPDCSGLQADNTLFSQLINNQISFINVFLNQVDKKNIQSRTMLNQAMKYIASLQYSKTQVLLQGIESTVQSLNTLASFLANSLQQVQQFQLSQQIADQNSDYSIHQNQQETQQVRSLYSQENLLNSLDYLDTLHQSFVNHNNYIDSQIDDALPIELQARNQVLASIIDNSNTIAKLMMLSLLTDQLPIKIVSSNKILTLQAEQLSGNRVASSASIYKGKLNTDTFSTSVRILQTSQQSTTADKLDISKTYDLVSTVYNQNPYAFDSKFPYPSSRAPVVSIQLILHEDATQKPLQPDIKYVIIFNGNTALQGNSNQQQQKAYWVCLQRDASNASWIPNSCKIVVVESGSNIQIECSCSKLLPTTVINDYKKKFQKQDQAQIFNLPFESTIILLPSLTLAWLVFSAWGCFLDKRQTKEKNTVKPSELFQDVFFDEKQNKDDGTSFKDADIDKEFSRSSVVSPDSIRKLRKQSTINGRMLEPQSKDTTQPSIPLKIQPKKIDEESNDDDKSNSGSNSSRINDNNNEDKKAKKPYISQDEIDNAINRLRVLQGFDSEDRNEDNKTDKKSTKSPTKDDSMKLSAVRKQSIRLQKTGNYDQGRMVDYQNSNLYQRKKSIRANTITVSPMKRRSIFFQIDAPQGGDIIDLEDKLTCWQSFLKKFKNYNGFFEPFFVYNPDAPRFFRFSILYMRFLMLYVATGIIAILMQEIYQVALLLAASSFIIHILSFYLKFIVASQYKCFKRTPSNKYYIYFIVLIMIAISLLVFAKLYFEIADDQMNYWGSLFIVLLIFNFCFVDFIFLFILPSLECKQKNSNTRVEQAPTQQDTKINDLVVSPRPKTEINLDEQKSERASPSKSVKLQKKVTKKKTIH